MAEKYIELIDKYRIVQSKDTDYNPPTYDWVDNTGEIVRCKDCRYSMDDKIFGGMWCRGRKVTPNWFCADGAKMDGEA